jgi:hypothetical protein
MSVGKNLLVEGKQWLMRGGSSASLSRVSEGKTKWCAGNSCTPGPGDRREHREESSRGSSPSKTRRPRIWPLVAGCDEDGLFVERGSHFFSKCDARVRCLSLALQSWSKGVATQGAVP